MKHQLTAFSPEIEIICVDKNANTFACNQRTYETFLSYPNFNTFLEQYNLSIEIVEEVRDNYVYMVDSTRIEEEMNV